MRPPSADPPPPAPGSPEWDILLTRYVSGEMTARERAGMDLWAAASPEHAAELAAWLATWRAEAAPRGDRFDARVGGRSLARRLDAIDAATRPSRQLRRRRWPAWAGAGIAIALLLAVSLSMGRLTGARSGRQQPFREFASAPGSRATVTLRDGTQLVLGPASRLWVPIDFGGAERAVELDGEALFTVVHDAAHPFAVKTTHAVIRDIGTVFTVHAYAADKESRVVVREGMVSIDGNTLAARDVAVFDSAGRISLRRGVNVGPYLLWVQGGLIFDNTPLPDAVKEVARAFDLDIVVADSTLLAHQFTASFGDEPADEVLDAMSIVMGGSYTRSGRRVVIRRRPGVADGHPHVSPLPAVLTDRTVHPTP